MNGKKKRGGKNREKTISIAITATMLFLVFGMAASATVDWIAITAVDDQPVPFGYYMSVSPGSNINFTAHTTPGNESVTLLENAVAIETKWTDKTTGNATFEWTVPAVYALGNHTIMARNTTIATDYKTYTVNNTDQFTDLTSNVDDTAVLIKVNITSTAGINKSTVDLSVRNINTNAVTDIIRDGAVVNGTKSGDHSINGGTSDYIRVSTELQEGYYDFSTVSAKNIKDGEIVADTTFASGIDFTVNMEGAALLVTPDNPALQDDGTAPRTAEENATVNVTVVDKFGHEMVFPELDVNTDSGNIELIKHTGTGTVTITKTTTATFYPTNTMPVQFNVSDTVAETITLKALDKGGLTSGYADQEFTPRIGGVDVYAADGEILADNVDYELVYLQLLDGNGAPIPKKDIPVEWFVENKVAAGAYIVEGTKTNVSGIATLNITNATVSGKTMTITGREKLTTSTHSDSDTVVTISGDVSNTNSELYVNGTRDLTQGTVNTTLNVNVLLKDNSGNLVVGKTVTLAANTTATFADSTPTSNSKGWANTTIRLPTDVGVTMVRAITGTGNLSLTPPELNQTVNVTSTPDVVTRITVHPSKNIGLENVPGTSKQITIQLQDTHGNDNTTATSDVLITTDNEALGNMTCDTTAVTNNLWCNITTGGSRAFTYMVDTADVDTANLTVDVKDYDFTDTIAITTSGPTGLNLTVNNTLPLVGEGVEATAQLTGPIGDISIGNMNITFTLLDPNDVLIGVNSTVTDPEGKATYSFAKTTRGVYTIRARNDDYGHTKTNITTYVGNATQVRIAVNNTSPEVNETITVYAIFKEDAGYNSSSVDGDNVNFLADYSLFDTDDISDGVASATYTQSTEGTVTLSVFYTNASSIYWEGTVPTDSMSVTFGAPPAELMEGDVDSSGCVDISDAMLVAQYDVGLITLTADQLKCGDTNDDGEVDITDAMHIAQYDVDPDGSLGVLYKPLWESPADDDMLEPVPC